MRSLVRPSLYSVRVAEFGLRERWSLISHFKFHLRVILHIFNHVPLDRTSESTVKLMQPDVSFQILNNDLPLMEWLALSELQNMHLHGARGIDYKIKRVCVRERVIEYPKVAPE
jgi:hypothetical protein